MLNFDFLENSLGKVFSTDFMLLFIKPLRVVLKITLVYTLVETFKRIEEDKVWEKVQGKKYLGVKNVLSKL